MSWHGQWNSLLVGRPGPGWKKDACAKFKITLIFITSQTQFSFSTLRSGILNYMIEMATWKFTSDNTVWPHKKIADGGLCSKRQATSYCECVCRPGTTKSGGAKAPLLLPPMHGVWWYQGVGCCVLRMCAHRILHIAGVQAFKSMFMQQGVHSWTLLALLCILEQRRKKRRGHAP